MEPQVTQSVLGTLGINWMLFMAQLVNFGIVVFVMWKWVYTPLLAVLDKRNKEIEDGLKNAQAAKKNLADANLEKEAILKEARVVSNSILDEAQSKADKMRGEKLAQAKEEIEKIVAEAKDKIQNERAASFSALQGDIAELVAEATTKVVGKMGEADRRDSIREAIKELKVT